MSATLQQVRDFVRNTIDTDDTELPDSVLDSFIRQGYNRIIRAKKRWPFFEASNDITVGATTYPNNNVDFDDVAYTGDHIDEIISVEHSQWTLDYVDYDKAKRLFPSGISTASAVPTTWSRWGTALFLWPANSASVDLTVRYYRQPADWTRENATTEADCPDDLSELIETWALGRAYAFLDDPEMAADNAQVFKEGLAEAIGQYLRTPVPQPFVLNGDKPYVSTLPPRLRFPFEGP